MKKNVGGEKRRKKKGRTRARPCVELSPSLLPITVYEHTELTLNIGPQSVHVPSALCIIVLRSQGQ